MYTTAHARLAIEEFGAEIGPETREYRVVVMDDGSSNPPIRYERQNMDGDFTKVHPCAWEDLPSDARAWARAARAWVLAPHCVGEALAQCQREMAGTEFARV